MVVFYIGIEARMVEGETRFHFDPESEVESFPYRLKTSNGTNVEKCKGYYPIMKLECISLSFQKMRGKYEHVDIVPWPNS